MSFESINPFNGQVLKSYPPLTHVETLDAVASADDAYRSWRSISFGQRRDILLKFASALREQQEELATLITSEMGKRIGESRSEIEYCAKITEFYADGAEEFLADQPMEIDGIDAFIQHAPLGVILGVMPWNFPFYQVVRFATPNIMAGNTVLLKHAANVPQCGQKIEQMLKACGLPDGVFTNLFIPTEFVETIIKDQRVRGVSLTGSEKAGASVASIAGGQLKRSVLELGGNDAFIVLEDADIDHAVTMAVKGRMVNAGQSCIAAKRFIVMQSVADEFMAGFRKALSEMTLGDPMDQSTDVAPLSTEEAADNLDQMVKQTINAGATVVLGGDRPQRDGAFYNPTILTDITPDMPTFDRELFGPVASVYVVDSEQDAIELANDSSYGLGGSVYSRDHARALRVARQIDTGMMFINRPTQSQAELPFGGVKNSGYGKELSHLGILEFVNRKLIHAGDR